MPAYNPGSTAAWVNKRINPRLQSCLCLTWSRYLSKRRRRRQLNYKNNITKVKQLSDSFREEALSKCDEFTCITIRLLFFIYSLSFLFIHTKKFLSKQQKVIKDYSKHQILRTE